MFNAKDYSNRDAVLKAGFVHTRYVQLHQVAI